MKTIYGEPRLDRCFLAAFFFLAGICTTVKEAGRRRQEAGSRRQSHVFSEIQLTLNYYPLPPASCLLPPSLLTRRRRRTLMPGFTQLHNPDPAVDVVEKYMFAELTGAPGEGHIRTEPLRVARP